MKTSSLDMLRQFLATAHWPVLRQAEPTFFSIAGIERRELALSNTYAFFFRSDEPHGLGSLFTAALLDILGHKAGRPAPRPPLLGVVRAAREHPMRNGKWLDLLLHDGQRTRPIGPDASFAILIENKVDHWLANDLPNYWESIPDTYPYKAAVVLGLWPERLPEPWVYVAHPELARAVEQRLGPALSGAHPRYLPVLLHFLDHLKQMGDSHDNFALAFDFVQRNRLALTEAQQVLNSVTAKSFAAAVADAFGPSYQQRGWFENRVDIQHNSRPDFRYVVFFGHVLDLTRQPGYTITLYAGGANKKRVAAWRQHLTRQPLAEAAGIGVIHWFMYDELVVGKQYYPPVGSTLAETQAHIANALREHWQPLEAAWLTYPEPPSELGMA